jgi:hypothetical protein
MPLLRDYIEHVGSMHQAFRKLAKLKEEAWENSLASARERYKKRYPEESIAALGAGFRDANGTVSNRQICIGGSGQVQKVLAHQASDRRQLL